MLALGVGYGKYRVNQASKQENPTTSEFRKEYIVAVRKFGWVEQRGFLYEFGSDELWMKEYWLNVLIVALVVISLLMIVISFAYPWVQAIDRRSGQTVELKENISSAWGGRRAYGPFLLAIVLYIVLLLPLLFSFEGNRVTRVVGKLLKSDNRLTGFKMIAYGLRWLGALFASVLIFRNGLLVGLLFEYNRGVIAAEGSALPLAADVYYGATWVLAACFFLLLIKLSIVTARFIALKKKKAGIKRTGYSL